jgi:hypothetical protein
VLSAVGFLIKKKIINLQRKHCATCHPLRSYRKNQNAGVPPISAKTTKSAQVAQEENATAEISQKKPDNAETSIDRRDSPVALATITRYALHFNVPSTRAWRIIWKSAFSE